MNHFFYRIASVLLLLLSSACSELAQPASAARSAETRAEIKPLLLAGDYVSVDSSKRTLTVFIKEKPVRVFDRIAFGSAGSGIKKRKGDDITPIGRFKIVSIRPSRKFRHFIALDYPSLDYAESALREGVISSNVFEAVNAAFLAGKTPPQDTALGGQIGIHGLGSGNIEIHRGVDWTKGCIALDNDQIEELIHLVQPGMMVDIR